MNVVCLVYDDRRRARDLISRMVAAVPDVHRVIPVVRVDELIRRLAGDPGQVVLVGTSRAVPGGSEVVHRILTVCPGALVVVVGSRDDAATVQRAVAAGACAFLRWDASPSVVSALLNAVLGAREASLSSHPAGMNNPSPANGTGPCAPPPGSLIDGATRSVQARLRISRREMQVLGGISEGMSNAEIGRELYLSDNTVKSHARRLFGKLEVHERAHAVAQAYRIGLLASLEEAPDRTG